MARSRRTHSHTHAPSQAQNTLSPAMAEHPLVPKGDPVLITTASELRELIDQIAKIGCFAYDTEFIGELSYYPRLCLIQIATRDHLALIDPMEDVDLTPLWQLIADPSVQTIVHSGASDLEPVVRHLDQSPANIFDTQVAAGFIGLPYPVGLAPLMDELLGVRLGKGLTFTHWDSRPLSPAHQHYAAEDVRYLLALQQIVRDRLQMLGNAAFAAEECCSRLDKKQYRFDPDIQYRRIRGWQSLKPRNLAVLRELVSLRDGLARDHDVPPRAFLKDQVLMTLAREPIKSLDKLQQVSGLPRPIKQAQGQRIVDATTGALAIEAADRPAAAKIDHTPTQRTAIDSLWAIATSYCLGRSIDPVLVTNRAEIADFYAAATRGRPVQDAPLMKGWRREVLGEMLVQIINGSADLHLAWHEGRVQATLQRRG